jgi:acetyl esterase/lipase
VVAVGHSAGAHLGVWAADRAGLPDEAPGAGPVVAVTGVISQGGVLELADCARDRLGEDAAIKLMGGGPDERPEPYRLADPMTWLPSPANVVCLHSRADQRVPYAYSERYVAAALAAGGRARLVQTFGDHFTLIDPATPDWAVAVAALPELLAG